MLEFARQTITGFPVFIVYFGLSSLMLLLFCAMYLSVTPSREVNLIKEGNVAAAASFSGGVIGFTLLLVHAVAQAANLADMLIWGAIALVVQLAGYLIVRLLISAIARDVHAGHVAPGVFLGAVAIAAGILNAACMTD